jgi:hypothetical protein
MNISDFRHVQGRIAKVLDAVENPNSETLSYEGGKRKVSSKLLYLLMEGRSLITADIKLPSGLSSSAESIGIPPCIILLKPNHDPSRIRGPRIHSPTRNLRSCISCNTPLCHHRSTIARDHGSRKCGEIYPTKVWI